MLERKFIYFLFYKFHTLSYREFITIVSKDVFFSHDFFSSTIYYWLFTNIVFLFFYKYEDILEKARDWGNRGNNWEMLNWVPTEQNLWLWRQPLNERIKVSFHNIKLNLQLVNSISSLENILVWRWLQNSLTAVRSWA